MLSLSSVQSSQAKAVDKLAADISAQLNVGGGGGIAQALQVGAVKPMHHAYRKEGAPRPCGYVGCAAYRRQSSAACPAPFCYDLFWFLIR
jgi:hypothetical protein